MSCGKTSYKCWIPSNNHNRHRETLYSATGVGNSSILMILSPVDGQVIRNIGPIGEIIIGLAIHPLNGRMYGVAPQPITLIEINQDTGAETPIGPLNLPLNHTVSDISFRADGTLYGWVDISGGEGYLITIDINTGIVTAQFDSFGVFSVSSGLTFVSNGTLYLFTYDSINGDNLVIILDPNTGQPIGPPILINLPPNRISGSLTVNADGIFYTIINSGNGIEPSYLAILNLDTHNAIFIGEVGAGTNGIMFSRNN